MAAQIPENPAPTTRTLSRLRFSAGSSFRVKAVVPLVVFPPEPVEWAIFVGAFDLSLDELVGLGMGSL